MPDTITSSIADSLIYLCRCVVNRETPSREELKHVDLEELYTIASQHMLAALVGLALQAVDIHTEQFEKAISCACWKTMILDAEKAAVCEKLNEAGIWHVPLKGAVIKDWYPEFGMRESADCDILFDKAAEEQVRDIMLGLGYSCDSYGRGHHDIYFKEPATNMQMHVDLFGEGYPAKLNDYFGNIREKLCVKKASELAFRPEDLYLYLISHEWEHYQKAGTGLRSVLDTYVFLQHFDRSLNWSYVEEELRKIGIEDFELRNRTLAQHLFGSGNLTGQDQEMLRYFLSSGVHGSYFNLIHNDIKRMGGGISGFLRYLFRRVFMPADMVATKYPFFARHRILLPVLPFYRLVTSLNKGHVQTELKTLGRKQEDDRAE